LGSRNNLKKWIQEAEFFLSQRVEPLPTHREFKPLKIRKVEPRVRDIMKRKAITGKPRDDIKKVATILLQRGINHLPIVDEKGKLVGIVTSWDLAKALAFKKRTLKEIMTQKVVTVQEDSAIDVLAQKMARHNISGVPVVDPENRVVGIVTAEDLSKKLVGKVR